MCCWCWCPGRWYFAHSTWTLRTSFVTSPFLSEVEQPVLYTLRSVGITFPFFPRTEHMTFSGVVWYWSCWQARCALTFSSWWCTTATLWTWQAVQVKYLCLPILCCVSITVCRLFSWLIDQLSCSLLNKEETFAVIDTVTPLKDLSWPPLSPLQILCVGF